MTLQELQGIGIIFLNSFIYPTNNYYSV